MERWSLDIFIKTVLLGVYMYNTLFPMLEIFRVLLSLITNCQLSVSAITVRGCLIRKREKAKKAVPPTGPFPSYEHIHYNIFSVCTPWYIEVGLLVHKGVCWL